LDPALGGFSYHGPSSNEDAGTRVAGHAGHHVLKIRRGAVAGSSEASFRSYQQPRFYTIAFSPDEVPASQRLGRSFPCVLAVESQDEPVTILVCDPVGYPAIAPRKEDWEAELTSAANRICLSLNGDENAVAREWWREYLRQATARADASVLGRALRPQAEGGMARVPAVAQQAARQSAAAAAMQGAAFRPHQPNVTSSLMSRQSVVALAAAADPVAAPGNGEFCFATHDAVADSYPACLVEVTGSNSSGSVRLKWWRLKEAPAAGDAWITGKWVPWEEHPGQHSVSVEPPSCLVMSRVQLQPSSKRSGGVHQQWAKVTAHSTREGALRMPRA
jgi:hypothetical protein